MSVRMLAAVWERSRHSGNDLLMMLAIADFADDDGKAYPAVQTLAKKCRMTPRNVNRVLAELRKGGELEIQQNEGPKGTNLYNIALPLTKASPLTERSPLTKASRTPDGTVPKPLTKPSDEPSVNRQEPVDVATLRVASKPATPDCPHQQIIEAYHELLPACPQVREWTPARQKLLRTRWVENPKRQAVDWWRRFFAYAAQSEFLTGRGSSRDPDRDPFVADLEWLIRPKNIVKVIEGKYHREPAELRRDGQNALFRGAI